MSSNKPIPGALRISTSGRVLLNKEKRCVVSAYVAEKKFIKFAVATISPDEFEKIIKRTLYQTKGFVVSKQELMAESLQDKFAHMDNETTIDAWNIALKEGISPTIKHIYLCKAARND